MSQRTRSLAVIGAGWAGCAAAIRAIDQGYNVTVFEASHQPGGRARALEGAPGFDNGQHILIGAYTATLALMQRVGVTPTHCLLRAPLDLRDVQQQGFAMPSSRRLKPALAAALGIWRTPWRMRSRAATLARMLRWQINGFTCGPALTVADLCQGLPSEALSGLIEPLCISALNLPAEQASGRVFLRVLRDAIMTAPGSSDSLIATQDLGQVFADPAVKWLRAHGATVNFGQTVTAVQRNAVSKQWHISTQQSGMHVHTFERVVVATPAPVAARLVQRIAPQWAQTAAAMTHTAIATVYARINAAMPSPLPRPMVATPHASPHAAQFVFDRGALLGGSQAGVLAAVVSHAVGSREEITDTVMTQLNDLLPAEAPRATWIQTVIEKRACFACTPHVKRPPPEISEGLLACGDYVEGPYPSTLEGAVRSAEAI